MTGFYVSVILSWYGLVILLRNYIATNIGRRYNQRFNISFHFISGMGLYTHDVHENWSIFKTPHPLVHLRPKFFHPLDVGRPLLNETPSPLPHAHTHTTIDNQSIKKNIIQGWLLYVIKSFLQVSFTSQYQLINLIWLFFDFFSFSWGLTVYFFVAILLCVQFSRHVTKCLFYL